MSRALDDNPQPFTDEELAAIELGTRSFSLFNHLIFSASFRGRSFIMADKTKKPFTLSELHYLWSSVLEQNVRACIMAPRLHLKSTICNHSFSFWQGFKARQFVDGLIFSFTEDLAREHTEIIKQQIIKPNPFCRFWIDNNPAAKSVIDFTVSFGPQLAHLGTWRFVVKPAGIFSAKRGVHPRFVICDDILSDFANPLEPKVLHRIESVFNQVIQSLPAPDDPLIVVGTPQSYDDTLYKLKENEEFWWGRFPAEVSGDKVAWPERFSYEVLQRLRRRVKEKAYQVEFLLIPLLAVNSRIPRDAVEACVDPELQAADITQKFYNPDNLPTFGGMDIGKVVHPTHISVFQRMHDGTLIQLYQKFIEGMPYNLQAKFVNKVVKHFDISRFYYDSTRAELDDRRLVKRARGKKFTKQLKGGIALLLERRIFADEDEPGIVLLPDNRQVNQICSVTEDLKSVETSEGHGDAFWSNALAVKAAEDGAGVRLIGNVDEMFASQTPRRQRQVVAKGIPGGTMLSR